MGGLNSSIKWLVSSLYVWVEQFHQVVGVCMCGLNSSIKWLVSLYVWVEQFHQVVGVVSVCVG